MAAVRVFAFLLLVAFSVQLVIAGVTRRDTESQLGADIQRAAASLQGQLEELLNRNVTDILSDINSQMQSLNTRFNDLATRLSEHVTNSIAATTAAPATR